MWPKPDEPTPDLYELVQTITRSDDIFRACVDIERFLLKSGFNLLSVKFCDSQDQMPAVRPFGVYPCEIKAISDQLRNSGGCPMTKEAIRLLAPFDAMTIPESRYPDFLSRRFLQEIRKTGHQHIAVVPVVFNRGIALYSVGTGDLAFSGQVWDYLVTVIGQITVALIARYPELNSLFEPKVLNGVQAKSLMLYANGTDIENIAQILDISVYSVHAILKSCVSELEASHITHAAAKAITMGEFVGFYQQQ